MCAASMASKGSRRPEAQEIVQKTGIILEKRVAEEEGGGEAAQLFLDVSRKRSGSAKLAGSPDWCESSKRRTAVASTTQRSATTTREPRDAAATAASSAARAALPDERK
eukprot:SM000180S03488  [mRNA]  locus=s180:14715:15263:- [translate_table: standard]